MLLRNSKAGFSLVEICAVLGIVLLITAAALVFYHGLKARADLNEAKENALTVFEGAKNKAFAGSGLKSHGVRITKNSFSSFEGEFYPGFGNETFLPGKIETDQASTTVIFKRLTGEPDIPLIMKLKHENGDFTKIVIASSGAIYSE